MLIITLVLLLALGLAATLGLATDLRHPAILGGMIWAVTFGLLSIPVVAYTGLSWPALAYLAVLVLLLLGSAILGGAIRQPVTRPRPLNAGPLLAFGWLALAAALAYQQARWGLVTLITNPGLVRSTDDGGTGLLGLLVYSPPLVFVLLVALWAGRRFNPSLRLPRTTWLFLLATLVFMAIQPERTTILVTLAWSALTVWAINPRPQVPSGRTLLRVVLPAALGLIGALGFFVSVSERTGKVAYVNSIRYAITLPVADALVDPYIYLTGSVPAFTQEVEKQWRNGDALRLNPDRTALLPRRVAQIAGFGADEKLTVNAEYARIPFLFNTYTMFYDPLSDYGLAGALLYTIGAGLIMGVLYRRVRQAPTPLTAYYYGWAVSALVFGTMTNKFSGPLYWLALVIPLLALMPSVRLAGSGLPRVRFTRAGRPVRVRLLPRRIRLRWR